MNLAVVNPNFSIVMPVHCNATCAFCFWEESSCATRDTNRLKTVINSLPAEFDQCSITGGEPTLDSALLTEYLTIARARFGKVVLSSNGFNIKKEHLELVDHLNISLHHHDLDKSAQKFNFSAGTYNMYTAEKYAEISKLAQESGVDVTFNCVLDNGFSDYSFVEKYIESAKEFNVSRIAFRKCHSKSMTRLPVEDMVSLMYGKAWETGCPVCENRGYIIGSTEVIFKYSIDEPTTVMDGVYELVYQQDGRVTSDWTGKHEFVVMADYEY